MEHKFMIGDKVKPIKKTSRHRELDNCAVYYRMLENNQDFLYVTGYDEVAASKIGENTYWCSTILNGDGDSFSESDLVLMMD